MHSETDEIAARYERRKQLAPDLSSFAQYAVREREAVYHALLKKYIPNCSNAKLLEIGAGAGFNIPFFLKIGVSPENIWANELLPDRAAALRSNFPDINVIEGDASLIENTGFDLIFQSTVLSSIVSDEFRVKLCGHLWTLIKPGGIFLSYDFSFNNPRNKDVRKVSVKELKTYFPSGAFRQIQQVTLAPPIGRRVGKTYPFFNLFPFLRTHRVVVIQKNP